jgi:nicotinamidase-related amidase
VRIGANYTAKIKLNSYLMKKGVIKKTIIGILIFFLLFVILLIINLVVFEKNSVMISKGAPIEIHDSNKSALLVIDIQEATTGITSTDSCYIRYSDDFIRNINQVTDSFRKQNIPVIFIRSEIVNPLINLLNDSYAKGSPGAQFDKRLKTDPGIVVVKNRSDSYRNTNLDNILIENKINQIYITGLDAAECVNSTVKAAQNRKYRVNLIEEAILSKSERMKDSMMADFRSRGVTVVGINNLYISKLK